MTVSLSCSGVTSGQPAAQLRLQHLLFLAGFAFVEGFAYAEDRFQLVGMRCEHLLVDDRVGLAKDLAPLTVPDNHILDEKLS